MNKISSIFLFLSTFVLASAADLDNDQLRIIDIIQTHPTINHLSSTVPLPVLIPSITVRLPRSCGTGGPCNLRDEKCMSNQMLKYVNDYRRTQGVSKMLISGSSSQLSNAVSHSKKMKQRGSIYHQQISKVNLGCSTFFSGENVAKRKRFPNQPSFRLLVVAHPWNRHLLPRLPVSLANRAPLNRKRKKAVKRILVTRSKPSNSGLVFVVKAVVRRHSKQHPTVVHANIAHPEVCAWARGTAKELTIELAVDKRHV